MTSALDYQNMANEALAGNDVARAAETASKGLNEHPDDVPLLMVLGYAFIVLKQYYQASIVISRATKINPDIATAWRNLTKCYAEIGPYKETYYKLACYAYDRAVELDPDNPLAYANRSYVESQRGDYDKAFEYAQEGLKRDSEDSHSQYNLSLSFLANHMWEEGWYCYDRKIDVRYSNGVPQYNLPLWNGEEDCTVLVAGEQGIGDEIMFSSMIPDLQKTNDVIIDTIARLPGLFGRSFNCKAYGTRFNATPHPEADFWVPMGSLGAFYRTKPEDFDGKPYLKADPQRKIQYRALLDSLSDKPKIGIAWSGGRMNTNERKRSLGLHDLAPILEYDAEWISLQYKNTDCPEFMHHWPRATVDCDYDETAALIDELDLIISVTTTAIHCAGALGKETWCLVPDRPQWRYGTSGNRMPWYSSVELLRQEGEWPIQEVCNRLSRMNIEKCRNLSTSRAITVLPRKDTRRLSPPLSKNAGLRPFLTTGLGKAA